MNLSGMPLSDALQAMLKGNQDQDTGTSLSQLRREATAEEHQPC